MLLLVDQVTQVHWLSLLLEGPLCRAHAEKRRRLPTAPEKRKKLEEMASELSNEEQVNVRLPPFAAAGWPFLIPLSPPMAGHFAAGISRETLP